MRAICFLVKGSLIIPTGEMTEHASFEPKSVVALNINKANHLLGYVNVGSADQRKLLSAVLGVGGTRLGTLHPVLGPLVNRDV